MLDFSFLTLKRERVGRKHVAGRASRKDCSDEGGISSAAFLTCVGVVGYKSALFRVLHV